MNDSRGALVGWSAATVLVSAFLLFQVQPMISKMILPWFGGSPAVWTTCMLFFQVFLLGGYTYAHLIDRLPRTRWQGVIHIILLLTALVVLPITPEAAWKPTDSDAPQWKILVLLTANVGLPYFLLASSAPLVQAWFSRACVGRSPYRLYALSNAGSLAALLTYPFLVEPALTNPAQGQLWSWAFAGFAMLSGGLAIAMIKLDAPVATRSAAGNAAAKAESALADRPPSLASYAMWLVLPAFGSMSLLAVTNHICQDVAVVPFLWVVPLSLYLITFIICFDSDRWYRRIITALLAMAAIIAVSAILLGETLTPYLEKVGITRELPDFLDSITLEASMYLIVLFLVCMLCHGELARSRPAPRYLTAFYLMISLGGALGGVFVALLCPTLFSIYVESEICLIGGFLIAAAVVFHAIGELEGTKRYWLMGVSAIPIVAGLSLAVAVPFDVDRSGVVAASRNFYGVLEVVRKGTDDDYEQRMVLYNGRILHGVQYLQPDRKDEPTTYYNEESGIGITLICFPRIGPMRVATVGLGTGTIASYGRDGDTYRFYEINPDVLEVARKHFTFLSDCAADVDVVLGDARLQMEQQPPQDYDVLALDAFSGDAIPAHLLTVEAFAVYLKHLRPDGVIAVHVSNRHLDLRPIVAHLAAMHDMQVIEIDSDDYGGAGDSSADWLLVTTNEDFLNDQMVVDAATDVDAPDPAIRVWTDQYSNLFQILK
jgi:spermidine synthase